MTTPPPPPPRRPGLGLAVAGIGLSVAVAALGVALAGRGTMATFSTGSLLATFGVAGVLAGLARAQAGRASAAARSDASLTPRTSQIDGEPATFHPRAFGRTAVLAHLSLAVMGAWALAMIALALLRGAPLWLVLLVPWAVLVLGGPVLALTGRLAPGGVYVTPTRVVDVDRGGRSAIALSDVELVAPALGRLLLRPRRADAVTASRAGWIWGRRPRTDIVVIDTETVFGGSELLADRVRRALPRP